MGLFFRNRKITRNTSDNNITISQSDNMMYDIGVKLGQIIENTTNTQRQLTSIRKRLTEHGKRIEILERKDDDKKLY